MIIFQNISPIWIIVFIFLFAVIALDTVLNFLKMKRGSPNVSVYEKKNYLFDTVSEFHLYKTLLELFGDKYHIFPQVNYAHIIKPKQTTKDLERKYRSSIDRKSSDFIFCDKDRVVPVLIIELDGSAHNLAHKKSRDMFINELTNIVGLPLLHLKNEDVSNKEFIKEQVNSKLLVASLSKDDSSQ